MKFKISKFYIKDSFCILCCGHEYIGEVALTPWKINFFILNLPLSENMDYGEDVHILKELYDVNYENYLIYNKPLIFQTRYQAKKFIFKLESYLTLKKLSEG